MPFKPFTATTSRERAFISITENGSFGMSRPFLDKYGISSDHFAIIFYDSDSGKVALEFSTHKREYSLPIRIPDLRYGAHIVAKAFFEHEKIDTRRYAGKYTDYDKVPLSKIGIARSGEAFLFTLVESEKYTESQTSAAMDALGW